MEKRKNLNSSNYAKAYKEVLEIIKYFPPEELAKIPNEKLNFIKQIWIIPMNLQLIQ